MGMTSSKPYLLRALYEWIADNNYTPQILVNTVFKGVSVPSQFLKQDSIVLNISPNAVRKLLINEEGIEFDARFGGMIRHIYIPLGAIESIFAQENERGMMFEPEFEDEIDEGGENEGDDGESGGQERPPRGKPNLKIVK